MNSLPVCGAFQSPFLGALLRWALYAYACCRRSGRDQRSGNSRLAMASHTRNFLFALSFRLCACAVHLEREPVVVRVEGLPGGAINISFIMCFSRL